MSEVTPHSGERRCCYLFPGQGAYLEEVFLELANSWPQVRQTFEEIDLALAVFRAPQGVPVLFNGSPPRLNHLVTNDPDTLQVALFGSAMATYRRVRTDRARCTGGA